MPKVDCKKISKYGLALAKLTLRLLHVHIAVVKFPHSVPSRVKTFISNGTEEESFEDSKGLNNVFEILTLFAILKLLLCPPCLVVAATPLCLSEFPTPSKETSL